jgi:NAD(P)-dependent dehydrogenase (short-subunit alcohol dehydrogenase family)
VYVTVGDVNEALGAALESIYPEYVELFRSDRKDQTLMSSSQVYFVKCDVRNWDDQVAMFKTAIQRSPNHSCDIVIANAGVVGDDQMFRVEDPTGEPVKPQLRIVDINLYGALYTAKLAMHYFRKQPVNVERDRCLILQASLAAYLDLPGSLQYATAKFGLRGLKNSLRRTAPLESSRVNVIAPWFIETPIMSKLSVSLIEGNGLDWATVESCNQAMLRTVTDKTINGQ